jgi:hypothetical protein
LKVEATVDTTIEECAAYDYMKMSDKCRSIKTSGLDLTEQKTVKINSNR